MAGSAARGADAGTSIRVPAPFSCERTGALEAIPIKRTSCSACEWRAAYWASSICTLRAAVIGRKQTSEGSPVKAKRKFLLAWLLCTTSAQAASVVPVITDGHIDVTIAELDYPGSLARDL